MLPDTQLPTRNDMYDYYTQFISGGGGDGCWNEDVEVVDPKDVGTPGTYFCTLRTVLCS